MKRTLFLLFFGISICSGNTQSSSPEIVSSSGETFQGNSIQIDWTLGEMAITTIQNSSNQITQGLHQPNYTITSVNELPQEIGQILVYPNPVLNKIEMKLNFDENRKIKIQLIDLNGRLIWTKESDGHEIKKEEDISNLAAGSYFINFIIDENQYSKIFKIQKIN